MMEATGNRFKVFAETKLPVVIPQPLRERAMGLVQKLKVSSSPEVKGFHNFLRKPAETVEHITPTVEGILTKINLEQKKDIAELLAIYKDPISYLESLKIAELASLSPTEVKTLASKIQEKVQEQEHHITTQVRAFLDKLISGKLDTPRDQQLKAIIETQIRSKPFDIRTADRNRSTVLYGKDPSGANAVLPQLIQGAGYTFNNPSATALDQVTRHDIIHRYYKLLEKTFNQVEDTLATYINQVIKK